MKLLEKLRYLSDFSTKSHTRELEKPNEDRLLVDTERNIFIILDGVTRPHEEYRARPYHSAAAEVGDIFLKEVYEYISAHIDDPEPEDILRTAVRLANERIRVYRERKSDGEWGFFPSTLGIISFLRDGRLHYVSVGDCLAMLVRRGSRILFARELSLEAVDLINPSKAERYQKYCNRPELPLSYTVFGGDDAVNVGTEYSFIDICEGDILFLATDGIASYLKYEKLADLKARSAEEIIIASEKYDHPPFAEYGDDKTLIKISF